MTKMTEPQRPSPLSPIASELAHLTLSGLSVKVDGKEVILSGAGTVLVPATHDLRKVVVGEAKYAKMTAEAIEFLEAVMGLIDELPPAACYMRTKKWRVLVIVLDQSEVDLASIRSYVKVWKATKETKNWDIIVFNAAPDGSQFEQIDLEILA
jgi:hypothetical protein